MTPTTRPRPVPGGVDPDAVRGRLDLRHVAEGVRRQGPLDHAGGRADRGVRPRRRPAAGRLLRRHARRSDHPAVGHRGAEEGVPAQDPVRARSPGARASASPTPASDLAGLKTTAVLDGDEWVINGQKIWTTQGFVADYFFILCRTDPDAPKHAGISYLLVPDAPARRRGPADRADRRRRRVLPRCSSPTPAARRTTSSAGVNNGWKVAMTTLGFERGTSATTGYRRFEKELEIIIDKAQDNGAIDDPLDPPGHRQGVVEGADHAHQRPALACRRSCPARRTSAWPRSAPPTRCSGASTTSEVMKLAIDVLGIEGQILTRRPRRWRSPCPATARARGQRRATPSLGHAVLVLLQPLRDDLGRHQPDPAQHRRRAGPRPAQGAEAGVTAGNRAPNTSKRRAQMPGFGGG